MDPIKRTVRLTKREVNALSEGRPIRIILLPPEEKSNREIVNVPPEDVERLILLWNENDYIRKDAVMESRNNPFPIEELDKHLYTLTRALRDIGLEELERQMGAYFSACSHGRHIWDGVNHGFKHLGGFVGKMLEKKSNPKKKSWWEVDPPERKKIIDNHPGETERLANAYARRFLRRDNYGLENPSDDYGKFREGAALVAAMGQKTGLTEKEVIRALLDCVEERCSAMGTPASPGWVNSQKVWKNYLPQVLKRLL